MDEYIVSCLLDVYNACTEVEMFFEGRPKLFADFQQDLLRQRAVERNVEIMGEAINRMQHAEAEGKGHMNFELPNARAIVSTRNRVIHSYDSVTEEFLWSLVINHIPVLKEDVRTLLANSEYGHLLSL